MIDGLGIDIIDLPRFKRAMERWGGNLTSRLFTTDELEYCMAQRRPEYHLAARFAAKVSFVKAYGRYVPFRDMEITRDAVGRPSLSCAGRADIKVAITMSHDGELAIAEALITTE